MKTKIALCLLLSGVLALSLAACGSNGKEGSLEIQFFQAGKADAILLTTDRSAVLIDCGEQGFGQTILDYLDEKGIEKLDCLIITHFDKDHVGGAAKVINNIEVDLVLQSNYPKDSEEYEKYTKALANAGLDAVTVGENSDGFSLGLDGVSYMVYPPPADSYEEDESNNSSLIVTVKYGTGTFLFMGDAQTERIAEYLSLTHIDCDLIKIPHHGGENEMMDELIKAADPEYAVICCSEDEPDISDTISVLEDAKVKTYLTYKGPVTVTCTGSKITLVQDD